MKEQVVMRIATDCKNRKLILLMEVMSLLLVKQTTVCLESTHGRYQSVVSAVFMCHFQVFYANDLNDDDDYFFNTLTTVMQIHETEDLRLLSYKLIF